MRKRLPNRVTMPRTWRPTRDVTERRGALLGAADAICRARASALPTAAGESAPPSAHVQNAGAWGAAPGSPPLTRLR
jgi:hypothetical protein